MLANENPRPSHGAALKNALAQARSALATIDGDPSLGVAAAHLDHAIALIDERLRQAKRAG